MAQVQKRRGQAGQQQRHAETHRAQHQVAVGGDTGYLRQRQCDQQALRRAG